MKSMGGSPSYLFSSAFPSPIARVRGKYLLGPNNQVSILELRMYQKKNYTTSIPPRSQSRQLVILEMRNQRAVYSMLMLACEGSGVPQYDTAERKEC